MYCSRRRNRSTTSTSDQRGHILVITFQPARSSKPRWSASMAWSRFRGTRRKISLSAHHPTGRRNHRVRYRRAEIRSIAEPKLLALLVRHEQTVYARPSSRGMFRHPPGRGEAVPLAAPRTDLSASDHLPFTQEYSRDAGSQTDQRYRGRSHLASGGLIKYARGKIQIVTRKACRTAPANATHRSRRTTKG